MKSLLIATACCVAAATASVNTFAMPQPSEKGMTVTVSGEASMPVPNDEAVLNFVARETAPEAKAATAVVVERANRALEAIKTSALSKVVDTLKTTDLSVNPRYTKATEDKAPMINAWEAVTRLSIVVNDVTKTGEVLQLVNSAMDYEGVSFQISPKKRAQAEQKLLEEAVKNAGQKMTVIASSLGLGEAKVRFDSIRSDVSYPSGPRYYAAPMMLAKARVADAAPQVQSGETELQVRVEAQGTIRP